MKYKYQVQIRLPGSEHWHILCECDSAVGAAEVVRVMLEHAREDLYTIQVFRYRELPR